MLDAKELPDTVAENYCAIMSLEMAVAACIGPEFRPRGHSRGVASGNKVMPGVAARPGSRHMKWIASMELKDGEPM